MKRPVAFLCILLALMLLVATVACSSKTSTVDWTIPADFSTYTDESGLFSVSYPSDWEVNTSALQEYEALVDELLESIESGVAWEEVSFVLVAGFPHSSGYHPNISIVVEPSPALILTMNALADAQLTNLEQVTETLTEISREITIIDGREAVIMEYSGSVPEFGTFHNLVMGTVKGGTVWSITCTSIPLLGDFDDYESDFHNIVRSLQIHK